MQAKAPALAPLFRSRHQLRLLGELFVGAERPLTISELAERTGMHPTTASREVARLAEHGHVIVETQGRNHLVRANPELPWYRELRSLLAQTIGPPALLANELAAIDGIDAAYIFGSWAARYDNEQGTFPRDLDVLFVGDVDAAAIDRACRAVERELRIDINPLIVTSEEWLHPDKGSFLAQVKRRPLVPISLQGLHNGGR